MIVVVLADDGVRDALVVLAHPDDVDFWAGRRGRPRHYARTPYVLVASLALDPPVGKRGGCINRSANMLCLFHATASSVVEAPGTWGAMRRWFSSLKQGEQIAVLTTRARYWLG